MTQNTLCNKYITSCYN